MDLEVTAIETTVDDRDASGSRSGYPHSSSTILDTPLSLLAFALTVCSLCLVSSHSPFALQPSSELSFRSPRRERCIKRSITRR